MCRWIAYNGQPIFIEQLVTRPSHSLVRQSLHTSLNYHWDGSLWSTNGDGFGIGWYNEKPEPGLFKDARPAWNDVNLRELCAQIKAKIFMAHIRATTTGAVQRSNSHPFKCRNWLFQHNGHINNFEAVRRDLQMAIAPEFYNELKGTTDSETLFLLAMSFGLERDPKKALREMLETVRKACEKAGIEMQINMSCAMTDGVTLYALRYAEDHERAKTQFYSTDTDCLRDISVGDSPIPENSVVFVSEPLDKLNDRWTAVPENSFTVIKDGKVNIERFME